MWSQLLPGGTAPSARRGHTAIYDPSGDRMVVFGGQEANDPGSRRNDVWALTLSGSPVWSLLLPGGTAPSVRFEPTAIYDPSGDRMVVFGGIDGSSNNRNDVWALVWSQAVDVGDHAALADRLALAPPRPNPFRGRVTFDFDVPRAAQVRLEVYDLRGRRVKTVEDALLTPGHYSRTWDGSDGAGAPTLAGIYFVRLLSPGATLRQKAVLIR